MAEPVKPVTRKLAITISQRSGGSGQIPEPTVKVRMREE